MIDSDEIIPVADFGPAAKLRAGCTTWVRDGFCQTCGKYALTGFLDNRPIARACSEGCAIPFAKIGLSSRFPEVEN